MNSQSSVSGSGCDLVSVKESLDTSTPSGRLFFSITGAFSEFERTQIAERAAIVRTHRKEKGLAYSAPGFGWQRDGDRLVAEAAEQKVIAKMKRMRKRGWSLRKVASKLDSDGIKTKRGGQWRGETVRSILASDADLKKARRKAS